MKLEKGHEKRRVEGRKEGNRCRHRGDGERTHREGIIRGVPREMWGEDPKKKF